MPQRFHYTLPDELAERIKQDAAMKGQAFSTWFARAAEATLKKEADQAADTGGPCVAAAIAATRGRARK